MKFGHRKNQMQAVIYSICYCLMAWAPPSAQGSGLSNLPQSIRHYCAQKFAFLLGKSGQGLSTAESGGRDVSLAHAEGNPTKAAETLPVQKNSFQLGDSERRLAAETLGMSESELFPDLGAKQFFLWEVDNTAEANLSNRSEAKAFLGELIKLMDREHFANAFYGESKIEWLKIAELHKNYSGGKIGPIWLNRNGLWVSMECLTGCRYTISSSYNRAINTSSFATLGSALQTERYNLSPTHFRALTEHHIPDSFAQATPEAKTFNGDSLAPWSFDQVKTNFKNDNDYFRFIETARQIGFRDRDELGRFLSAMGYHRGVDLIIRKVQTEGLHARLKSELLRVSEHQHILTQSGTIPLLKFSDTPEVDIYRGTNLSESAVAKLLSLQWEDYSEPYEASKAGKGFSPWGRGKYFSIDKVVGLRFALSSFHDAPRLRAESFYTLIVEAKVPREHLSKKSKMARWDWAEFQYDPDRLKPNEISVVVFLLPHDQWLRIPGEMLRRHDRAGMQKLFREAGISDENTQKILAGVIPTKSLEP